MGQPQAIRALVDDEPMKSIPTRAGFVAETKPRPAPGETSRHLDQNLGTVLKNPELPNPPLRPPSATAAQTVALCTSNPTYVISSIRPVPMQEALCRPSGTTLDIVHAEDGPPITQRTSGLEARKRRDGEAPA